MYRLTEESEVEITVGPRRKQEEEHPQSCNEQQEYQSNTQPFLYLQPPWFLLAFLPSTNSLSLSLKVTNQKSKKEMIFDGVIPINQ
jgi:hypothetical protein